MTAATRKRAGIFCNGLARTARFKFSELERRLLDIAGETILESLGQAERNVIECERCTVQQAAWVLGIDRRSLQRWRHEGCPWNADGTVSIPKLFQWRLGRAVSQVAQKSEDWAGVYRKWKARAARLNYQRLRGELVTLADAIHVISAHSGAVRNQFTMQPGQLAALLEQKSREQVRELLEQDVADRLVSIDEEPWPELEQQVAREAWSRSCAPDGPRSGHVKKSRSLSGRKGMSSSQAGTERRGKGRSATVARHTQGQSPTPAVIP